MQATGSTVKQHICVKPINGFSWINNHCRLSEDMSGCRSSRPTPSSFKSNWLCCPPELAPLPLRHHLTQVNHLIQLTPGAMQLGVALQGSSNRSFFPSFIIWTFPMIHLGEFLSSRFPVWYTSGSSSDCSSHLKPMWSSRNASPLWWRFFKRTSRKKDWYTSCNCAWEQLRRLLNR